MPTSIQNAALTSPPAPAPSRTTSRQPAGDEPFDQLLEGARRKGQMSNPVPAKKTTSKTKSVSRQRPKEAAQEAESIEQPESPAENAAEPIAQPAAEECEPSQENPPVEKKGADTADPQADEPAQTSAPNQPAGEQIVAPVGDRPQSQVPTPEDEQAAADNAKGAKAQPVAAPHPSVSSQPKVEPISVNPGDVTDQASAAQSQATQSTEPGEKQLKSPAEHRTVSPLGAVKNTDPARPIPSGSQDTPQEQPKANADLASIARIRAPDMGDEPESDPGVLPAVKTPADKTTLDPAMPAASGEIHFGDKTPAPVKAPLAAPAPEIEFAQSNHDRIVTGIRGQLLPQGGTMQIRLDPPELGALQVMVEIRDGTISATFQTSNDQATQLLSHSLNQLKHVLEGQGIGVERIQVQQAPRGEHSHTPDDQQSQSQWSEEHASRQEQQRKELLRRMWRRVSGAGDPIDFMA